MTTQLHTAAKLALDALETCDPGDYSTGHVIHPSYDDKAVNAAIDALRHALAAPQAEQWTPVATPLEYLTRCADGTTFLNVVQMPAHAVEWSAPPAAPDRSRDVAERLVPPIDGFGGNLDAAFDAPNNCGVCHGDPNLCDVHDCGDAHKSAPAPVPDGMVPEWATFLEYWTHESHLQTFADRERFRAAAKAMIAASPAAPVVPDLKHCACEFDGDTCVTQCKLHAAHVDAIHEWAERAKAAEGKLSATPVVPDTTRKMP